MLLGVLKRPGTAAGGISASRDMGDMEVSFRCVLRTAN